MIIISGRILPGFPGHLILNLFYNHLSSNPNTEVIMKTTKLLLLIAIMVITTTGFSQPESAPACAEKQTPTYSVSTTVKSAMENPILLKEMYHQLSPEILKLDRPVYVVALKVKNVTYFISGTYKEWEKFFKTKPKW